MQAKMNLCITVTPKVKSRELYEELLPYNANVIDLGDKVYVRTQIDIREDAIEKIIEICDRYGECSVDANLVEAKPSSK